MIRFEGINASIAYVIHTEELAKVNDAWNGRDLSEATAINADDMQLGQIVLTEYGEAIEVLDKFETADGQGHIVMTGDPHGDLEWWSTQATFLVPVSG